MQRKSQGNENADSPASFVRDAQGAEARSNRRLAFNPSSLCRRLTALKALPALLAWHAVLFEA